MLICACGAFSLIGFPLDDIWHRLFGQDVTLWGPTHLMLIGGAAMTLVGIAVLTVEGMRANAALGAAATGEHARRGMLARAVALTGGLLLGLSTFQAEFDFGVPQFRFVFEPMLMMLAAGVGLVAARDLAGRGAALGAALFFLVVRGGLALLVGPVLGETTPHFPLYLVEALVVEVVALRVSAERPLRFGLWAGLGIGTIGLAAEWAWSHVWMPLPVAGGALPEAAIARLRRGACRRARRRLDRRAALAIEPGSAAAAACAWRPARSAAALAALIAFALYTPDRQRASAPAWRCATSAAAPAARSTRPSG